MHVRRYLESSRQLLRSHHTPASKVLFKRAAKSKKTASCNGEHGSRTRETAHTHDDYQNHWIVPPPISAQSCQGLSKLPRCQLPGSKQRGNEVAAKAIVQACTVLLPGTGTCTDGAHGPAGKTALAKCAGHRYVDLSKRHCKSSQVRHIVLYVLYAA